MRRSSSCGFDFTDYGMLGVSRPGPVNRHDFEIAGWAGARLAVGRMADRAAEARSGGRRNLGCPEGAGEEGGGVAAALRKIFQNYPCIGG